MTDLPNAQFTADSSFEGSDKRVSGRLVVIAMFTLGIVATGILWTYWNLHLMPFMPLQEALSSEFEESSPRVDGGRRKIHKGTPMVLRVVMRVPFDPTVSDAETQTKIEERLDRTRELAIKHTAIDEYELLDVHLYFEPKEKEIRQKTFQKTLKSETAE